MIRNEKLMRDYFDGWSKVHDYKSSFQRKHVDFAYDCFTEKEYRTILDDIWHRNRKNVPYKHPELVKRYRVASKKFWAKLLEISRKDV